MKLNSPFPLPDTENQRDQHHAVSAGHSTLWQAASHIVILAILLGLLAAAHAGVSNSAAHAVEPNLSRGGASIQSNGLPSNVLPDATQGNAEAKSSSITDLRVTKDSRKIPSPWPRGFPTGPWWNGGLFCGPNALYILMKLHEVPVELEEIHSQISIKPERGCTPHQLVDTGSKLGLPLEVRFVKATDLLEVQRPFILHGAQSEDREDAKGHFWVIVGYDEAARSFAVVDGSSGIYRFTSIAQVEKLFSGWVVVPKVTAAQSGWQISKVAFMSSLALVIVAGVYLLMLDDRVRRLNGQPQASTTAS